MGRQAVNLRAADATDWRWARDNERRVLVRVAAIGLFVGLLAVEIASLVPELSPSHVAIWRWALGVPVVITVALMIPRCFGKPITTRFIWGCIVVGLGVVSILPHIAPPTWAMLLTPIAFVICVAHFMSARETIVFTGLVTIAVCALPVLSPPGELHQYTYAQLAAYVPVLWALAATFYFQARGLREAVEHATVTSVQDSETGVGNLRLAEEDFARRLGDVEHGGSESVGLVLVNVANLGELDHAGGQRAAERVVASVAQQLRRVARPEWTIARIDAGDFLILMSDTSPRRLDEIALLCRGAANAASADLGASLVVNAGAASAPAHGNSLGSLLDFAQGRVYSDRAASEMQFAPSAVLIAAADDGSVPSQTGAEAKPRRISRRQALLADVASFGVLACLIAATGGADSPAMVLVFVFIAAQAWLWRERLVGWRVLAPMLLLASPLLYESLLQRDHPWGQASFQFNSMVVAFIATVTTISVHRSRSHAHAVARRATSQDPETALLNRQAFNRNAERAAARALDGFAVIRIELRGTDRFTRSAGRSERSRLMIALGDRLTALARADEVVGRLGTSTFAVAVPGESEAAALRAEEIRSEVSKVVFDFVAGRLNSPRIELSVEELASASADQIGTAVAAERAVGGLTTQVAS